MWPFSRKAEPDELLGTVSKGVLAAIGALQQRIIVLEKNLELERENSAQARALEKSIAKCGDLASSTRGLLEDHVSRIDAAIVNLRGQLTGGRGGRPRGGDAQAAEIGRALVESLGLERAAQLANEVVDKHNAMGNGRAGGDPDNVFA